MLAGDGGEAQEERRPRALLEEAGVVNWETSSVTSKKPWAALPLAWTTRSGTRSRLKCCIFWTV